MSNVTVQEALKAAIRFARINPHVGMYENSNSNHVVYGAELAKTFEAALSEIEKCEPVYLIVSGADEIVVTKEKYDSWTSAKRISYTSPISKEWLGLSEQEVRSLVIAQNNSRLIEDCFPKDLQNLADAISTKLKQLNVEKG